MHLEIVAQDRVAAHGEQERGRRRDAGRVGGLERPESGERQTDEGASEAQQKGTAAHEQVLYQIDLPIPAIYNAKIPWKI